MTPIDRMRLAFARVNVAQRNTKSSAVGGLGGTINTWLTGPGAPNWSSRRYDRFAEEGYRKNVIAYRSVRLIAEGGASIPWLLYKGEEEVAVHPLLDLLKRPNPMADGASFLEAAYGFLLIAGNVYIEAVGTARGIPGELYCLRPDRMKVIPGAKGWPRGYQYSVSGQSHVFEHDPARGVTPILHLKSFHPLDDHYGLSAFEPGAYGIDLHNESSAWNKALLDNAARPSGALVYDPGEVGASLTPEQFERLKAEMEAQFQGGRNAGRPLLLEGGLSWQQLGFSPADMDFINAKHVSAREIALAFGVPPMLLGIPGDNTYANYTEANRALWRQTILPMARKLAAALNAWLAPKFADSLRLDIDTDAIEALSADRAQTWAQVGAASFLTMNEKRAALGYGPIAGGDQLQPAVPVPPLTKGRIRPDMMQSKGVIEDRAARYADLLREHEVAIETGATVKTWKTAGDGEVRHSHAVMEGVTIPIDESFEVSGERLFLPSDPAGSLDETANCRCYVTYSVNADGGGDQANLAAVSAYGNGTDTIIVYGNGLEDVRHGGTRSWRNNNPGNLRNSSFSIRHGSLGEAGGFAVFSSEDVGWEALLALLRGATYQALTLEQAIETYAPPDENDTVRYLTFLAGKLDVPASMRLSELSSAKVEELAALIKQFEGWSAGAVERRKRK